MKYTLRWIIGMLANIFYDFLIMIWGIFSKQTRKRYIEQFYPQYLETEEQKNE